MAAWALALKQAFPAVGPALRSQLVPFVHQSIRHFQTLHTSRLLGSLPLYLTNGLLIRVRPILCAVFVRCPAL